MNFEEELAALQKRVDEVERDLGARVAVLERRLDETGAAAVGPARRPIAHPTAPPPPSPRQRPSALAPPPPPSPDQQPVAHPPPPGHGPPNGWRAAPPAPAEPGFEVGLEVVLRWVGIALVVLSAVFLVSTAISRGWIGPELQLLGATIGGLALLGSAVHLLDTRREFAVALGNGGAVVIAVCAGAAYGWLELFSAGPALGLVTAATLLSVLVARRLGMESVAVTATVSMFVVPTVAEILADAPVTATGVWLGLFALSATAFGLVRRWVLYRIASIWTTALWVIGLAAALADEGDTDHTLAGVMLVAVVGLVLWCNPMLARRFAHPLGSTTGVRRTLAGLEHRSAILLPVWAWGSIVLFSGMDVQDTGGWFGLVLAAGFAAVALLFGLVERWITEVELTSQLLGAGLLATVSALAWLGGPTLIVVVAGQALATLIVSGHFPDLWLRIQAYALGILAGVLLAAALIEGADSGGPTVAEHAAYGVVMVALAAMAWLTDRRGSRAGAEVAYGLVWMIGIGYVCSLVAPVVEDRAWLFVGVALSVAGAAASRRLGVYVLALSALVGGVTVVSAAASMVEAADSGTDLVGHLANLSVVLTLAVATYLAWFEFDRSDAGRPLLVVSWVFAMGWLGSALIHVPQGQVAVSGAWALAAGVAVLAGVRTGEPVVRVLGLGTLAVVLTKLLTVDLAEVETLWRVALFLSVGLGLLRLGYVLPALAERYGPPDGSLPDGSQPDAAPPSAAEG